MKTIFELYGVIVCPFAKLLEECCRRREPFSLSMNRFYFRVCYKVYHNDLTNIKHIFKKFQIKIACGNNMLGFSIVGFGEL